MASWWSREARLAACRKIVGDLINHGEIDIEDIDLQLSDGILDNSDGRIALRQDQSFERPRLLVDQAVVYPGDGAIDGHIWLTQSTLHGGTLSNTAIITFTESETAPGADLSNEGEIRIQRQVTLRGPVHNLGQIVVEDVGSVLRLEQGLLNDGRLSMPNDGLPLQDARIEVLGGMLVNAPAGEIFVVNGVDGGDRSLIGEIRNEGIL